jgi:hypothetical protein
MELTTVETGGILHAALGFFVSLASYLISRIDQTPNFVISTGAVLCALSFTAGTILLQKLPVVQDKSPGEKWLEGFLAKAYSRAVDTSYHRTGTIVKRYVDEFIFHEFPNFGVDRYSGTIPRTRPNFELGRFLSQELGSAVVHVGGRRVGSQPIETSRFVRYTPPLGVLWSRLPRQLRRLFDRIRLLRLPIWKLTHERPGVARYTTVSYRLVPIESGTGARQKTRFDSGTPAEWAFDDIKRFEGKTSRIAHLVLEIQFYVGWYFLLLRRLPAFLSHPRDQLFRVVVLGMAKEARRKDTQLRHIVLEIRNLHAKILYSKPIGKHIWPSLATVTFVFDRLGKNHAQIFMYTTELQYSTQARRFAESMLDGARAFGVAAVLGVVSLLWPASMMSIVSLAPYSYAWYILLLGLWKFRNYFIVSKEQENVGFAQPLRCPSCGHKIKPASLVCPHCRATVSAKIPRKPPPKVVVSETEPVSAERWKRFVTAARKEHVSMSRKTTAIPFRPAQPADVLEFKEFCQRLLLSPDILIDAYSAGDTYTSPEVIGFGRHIAFQEERYLIHRLLGVIANKTRISRLSGHEIEDAIQYFRIIPSIVFAPIEYFTPLHMDPRLGMQITYDQDGEHLAVAKMRIPIFWSNVYAPFKEFIFLESGLGEWVFKPDNESNWLRMDLSPERRNGKFEVTARTLAEFLVKDGEKGLIVTIESPQPPDRSETHSLTSQPSV